MRKSILLAIPFSLLLFSGCGRRNNTKNPTSTKPTKTQTTKDQTTTQDDPIPLTNKDIYVSTTGHATSDGADESDPTTFEHALELVYSGDTIYLAKGTYTFSNTISITPATCKNGSEIKRNRVIANEGAVFDFDSTKGDATASNGGITITCSYWQFENITVKNSDNYGFDVTGKGNKLVNCIADNNSNGGFNINNASLTTLNNCIANNNHVDGYFAYGFYISGSGENNSLDSCIATNNQDSGFFINNTKKIALNKCYAENNGNYNTGSVNRSGFVFNDKGHVFTNCISYNNAFYGFYVPTSSSDKSDYTLFKCSAINNHKKNYSFVTNRNTTVSITNVLSYNDNNEATNDFLVGKVTNCFIYYSNTYYPKSYLYIELDEDYKYDISKIPLDISGYTNKYIINTTVPDEMKKDGKTVYFDEEGKINFYDYLDRSLLFQDELFENVSTVETTVYFGANINE